MDFGIVATSAGGNTDAGQPDIYPIPSYYYLQKQYAIVAETAAALQPNLDVSNAATKPLACPTLTNQVSSRMTVS